MLDVQGPITGNGPDPAGLESEQPGPVRVVLGEGDRSVMRFQVTGKRFPELLRSGPVSPGSPGVDDTLLPLRPVGNSSPYLEARQQCLATSDDRPLFSA